MPSGVTLPRARRLPGPHALLQRARRPAQPRRASGSSTRRSATTSTRSPCSSSRRRAACSSRTSASATEWILRPYVEGVRARTRSTSATSAARVRAIAERPRRVRATPGGVGLRRGSRAAGAARVQPACADGRPDPPRQFDAAPIDRPPFYVIEAVPGDHVHVRRPAGRRRTRACSTATGGPIPGLLAAGADAGGLYVRAYAGGLAAALVFGLRAARTALEAEVAVGT